MTRAGAWLRLAAVGTALLLCAPARADDGGARPYDAPRVPQGKQTPEAPADYDVMNAGGIVFVSHPAARTRMPPLVAAAPAARAEVASLLGAGGQSAIEVRVAALQAEMARLSPGDVPPYAAGVAFGERKLIVLSLSSPRSLEPPKLEVVLRHELAHLGLDEALGLGRAPRWFHEGFAVHVATEQKTSRARALAVAAFRGRLLPIAELDAAFPSEAPEGSVAYAESAELVRYLLSEPRARSFRDLVTRMRVGESFDQALSAAYSTDTAAFEEAFLGDVTRRFALLPGLGGAAVLCLIFCIFALRRAAKRKQLARAGAEMPAEASGREGRKALPARVAKAKGALWMLKRSRAEGASALDGAREQEPGEAAPRARREVRVLTIGGRVIEESVEMGATVASAPEVPKVKHDGRWHTLH